MVQNQMSKLRVPEAGQLRVMTRSTEDERGFSWEAGDKQVNVPNGLSTWVLKTLRTSIRAWGRDETLGS